MNSSVAQRSVLYVVFRNVSDSEMGLRVGFAFTLHTDFTPKFLYRIEGYFLPVIYTVEKCCGNVGLWIQRPDTSFN